jgi:hypothetical protein
MRVAGRLDRPGKLSAPHLLTAASVLLLAAFLLGCGSEDDGSDGQNGELENPPPNLISDEEIAEQQEGTPERALLEWWQAFQFQDSAAVIALTTPKVLDDVGENNLEELVQARGQGLQKIEVLGASENGDSASLRAGLLTFQPPAEGKPPPDEPTASTPTTFVLAKEDDEWLFDDDAYLEPLIESLKAAEEQAEEPQSQDEAQSQDEQSSGDASS